jgi:hypothetical protein
LNRTKSKFGHSLDGWLMPIEFTVEFGNLGVYEKTSALFVRSVCGFHHAFRGDSHPLAGRLAYSVGVQVAGDWGRNCGAGIFG